MVGAMVSVKPSDEQTLVGTFEMLIYCRELPIFIFCSHHSKTTKEAYLKSFEQGSWLWISATTNKQNKITYVQLLQAKRNYSAYLA